MDEDGYPTEESLDRVRLWPHTEDFTALMSYVKGLWLYDEPYWREEDGTDEDLPERPFRRYLISTAGWSGNESVIAAMQENRVFWMFCWWSSRRGGHYEFRVPHV